MNANRVNWNDYSSEATSSILSSQPSSIKPNPELQKLLMISPKPEMVWLKVDCQNAEGYEKEIIRKLRENDHRISVYKSDSFKGFNIKVYWSQAEKYLKDQIPGTKNLSLFVKEKSQLPSKTPSKMQNRRLSNSNDQKLKKYESRTNSKNKKYVQKNSAQKRSQNKQKQAPSQNVKQEYFFDSNIGYYNRKQIDPSSKEKKREEINKNVKDRWKMKNPFEVFMNQSSEAITQSEFNSREPSQIEEKQQKKQEKIETQGSARKFKGFWRLDAVSKEKRKTSKRKYSEKKSKNKN